MAYIIFMGLELKMMSLSQLVCPVIGDFDVPHLNEDWLSSLSPEQYKSSVSLCPTHAHMYHSLRGFACVTGRIVPQKVLLVPTATLIARPT